MVDMFLKISQDNRCNIFIGTEFEVTINVCKDAISLILICVIRHLCGFHHFPA